MGTETVRPSLNSTIRVSAVTLTFLAVAVSVARLEVLMPCLDQFGFVLLHQRRDLVQFCWGDSMVVFHPNWTQPELRGLQLALDVHVNRFPRSLEKKKNRCGPL